MKDIAHDNKGQEEKEADCVAWFSFRMALVGILIENFTSMMNTHAHFPMCEFQERRSCDRNPDPHASDWFLKPLEYASPDERRSWGNPPGEKTLLRIERRVLGTALL